MPPILPPETVIRTLGYLHPVLNYHAQEAISALQETVPGIRAFETWRGPLRQSLLYRKGRISPYDNERKVTNSLPWHSWHQFGLALDLAVFRDNAWSWEFDTEAVRKAFIDDQKLESGPKFESCHFQLTGGLDLVEAFELHRAQGILAVWLRVDQLLAAK